MHWHWHLLLRPLHCTFAEMLMDLSANVWVQTKDGGCLVARETCDAVQDDIVVVLVDGQPVGLSNYVLPAWFDPHDTVGPFDRLRKLTRPFAMTEGGYLIHMKGGKIPQTFGSAASTWTRTLKSAAFSRRVAARSKGGSEES